MDQKGYISGETLLCAENTNKVLVISKWETLKDWNNWKSHEKRVELDAILHELQDNPTIYEPYVFKKYRVAAEQGFPPPLQKQQSPSLPES
jgi:heme-degrading monooxygenase HmoA